MSIYLFTISSNPILISYSLQSILLYSVILIMSPHALFSSSMLYLAIVFYILILLSNPSIDFYIIIKYFIKLVILVIEFIFKFI